MFRTSSFRVVALIVMAVGALTLMAACSSSDSSSDATPTVDSRTAAPNGTTGTSGGNGDAASTEVEVSMKDNFFEPKEITVPVGVEVEIETKNDGAAIHNMVVFAQETEGQDYRSDVMVKPGDTSDFKVKFSKAGTYDFQCDYHVPDMVGTITAK